jgi:hypothetical protein
MFANVLALPGEHRHSPNPRLYFGRDVQKTGIDLAAIQNTVEKLALVRCQDEEESEPIPAECDGFIDPSINVALAGEAVARQADRELLAKLTRIAFDGIERHGPPIPTSGGAEGQNCGLDAAPIQSVDR